LNHRGEGGKANFSFPVGFRGAIVVKKVFI